MKINKGQISLNDKKNNFIFEIKRGKGHLLAYMVNRIRWHLYPRIKHVSKFPDHIDIEISSACNLKCPMCYTVTDEFKEKIQVGLMDLKLYKKLIDNCKKFKPYSIRISFRGEAFLHPNIFEMIEYAKNSGIKEVSSLTHGGMLNEEKFRKLIDLKLDWLTISFDGLGEEYNKIRAPNKFDEQLEKVKRFSEIKKELGVVKPLIKIQTISSAIEKNPEEFYNTFSSISDQIATNPLIDFSHTVIDENFIENFTCPQPWQRLVIGSDGKAMMCSMDEMGSYIVGDLNTETIQEVWNGKKMNKAREIHMKELGVKELPPCKWCIYPRKTENKNILVGDRVVPSFDYVNWKEKNENVSTRYRKNSKE